MQAKVLWHEGLFMQPQHLQQQDRYLENYTWTSIKENLACAFGFSQLSINNTSLSTGAIVLQQAAGIMPDGTHFDFAELSQQASLQIKSNAAKNQLVYLCLTAAEPNICQVTFDAQSANHAESEKRFVVTNTTLPDMTIATADKVEAQLIQPNFRLKLEKELRTNEVALAVAKIQEVYADSRVVLDPNFIPTVLRCNVSSVLGEYVLTAKNLVNNRAIALAARLSQSAQRGVGEITDFLSLQLLNRYKMILAHFNTDLSPHPLDFYHCLIQLVGEASTYMSEKRTLDVSYQYYHLDLQKTFLPLMDILQNYLVDVLDQAVIELPIQDRGNGWRLSMIQDISLIRSANFILAVAADVPAELVATRMMQTLKIGAVERIKDIVSLQLPGVSIKYLPLAPRQLPYLAGYTYFELERKGEQWGLMEQSKALAMHLAVELPNIKIKLWAIKSAK